MHSAIIVFFLIFLFIYFFFAFLRLSSILPGFTSRAGEHIKGHLLKTLLMNYYRKKCSVEF